MSDIDALLQEWGASARLGEEQAEQIRRSILDEPVIGAQWWADFSARLAQTMMRSVQPPAALVA